MQNTEYHESLNAENKKQHIRSDDVQQKWGMIFNNSQRNAAKNQEKQTLFNFILFVK